MKHLHAKKSLQVLLDEMEGDNRLKRVLGPFSLTALGVGAIIGTGIFVLVGKAAHDVTGPALMLSFVVAGLACVFAALCYAEFASMAPVAGSAYTYAYTTMGELWAWIIGWDLVLEYTVASAAVAQGWSKYFQDFLNSWDILKARGIVIPKSLSGAPFDYTREGVFITTGTLFDLPAVFISLLVTVVLVVGIRESTRFNGVMVLIKLAVVLLVIVLGVWYIDPNNWKPFAPFGWTGVSIFGFPLFGGTAGKGMLAGAAIIFFAYIGFDSISTHSEEARNPKRDVPIGIIASLALCTVLYIAVAAVLTGMVPYDKIDVGAPVSAAFGNVGLPWIRRLISLGAIAGITSVLLVMMLSQPRVLLAMARDGLLPKSFFGAVHPKFQTPWKSTIFTGFVVALGSSLLPLSVLADLVNIGTLLAFVIVCAAVLIMRKTNPEAERPFRCPLVPLVPLLGIFMCLVLMFSLPWQNWARLAGWLGIGMVIYFCYGVHHSVLGKELRGETVSK